MTPPLDCINTTWPSKPDWRKLLHQAVDVGADLRRHVRVDERRRGPFELGCPGEHLVRQRDVPDVGILLADQLAGPALVVGVHEAEEEAHGDGLHAQLLQPAHAPAHRLLVERQHHVALEVTALGDRNAGPAAGDRHGRGSGGVPDLLLVVPPQLDLVAVPLGGQQAGGGAAHLDHGVVRRGRPVDERLQGPAEGRGVEPEGGGQLLHSRQDADRLVVWSRRGLVEDDPAVGRDADQVGERAPHVDADPVAILRHAHPPGPAPGGRGEARS